jgi:hypothetical protein
MDTLVKITWDQPEEQNWLCADNIKIALSAYCKNTKFDVEDLNNEMTASEAIYGFCAWLTCQEVKTIMSSKHDCAVIADRIKEFCETNKLTEPKDKWTENLKHPDNLVL